MDLLLKQAGVIDPRQRDCDQLLYIQNAIVEWNATDDKSVIQIPMVTNPNEKLQRDFDAWYAGEGNPYGLEMVVDETNGKIFQQVDLKGLTCRKRLDGVHVVFRDRDVHVRSTFFRHIVPLSLFLFLLPVGFVYMLGLWLGVFFAMLSGAGVAFGAIAWQVSNNTGNLLRPYTNKFSVTRFIETCISEWHGYVINQVLPDLIADSREFLCYVKLLLPSIPVS